MLSSLINLSVCHHSNGTTKFKKNPLYKVVMINTLKELELSSKQRKIPILQKEKAIWLLKIIKEHKPKTILELGTANGYSGCILGSEGAELTTIEINPKAAAEAQDNFLKHNIKARILVGDATKLIKTLDKPFDLIFIDFALSQYITILDDCLRLSRPGTIIIADNINLKVKRNTGIKHCQDFKERIIKELKTEIIEIGDGLSYSII